MTRKINPERVHPARIVDLQALSYDSDGYRHATLVLPGVPPNQVEAIGQACARAILGVLGWPDDQAADMAERVRKRLADELAQRIEWDDAARADAPAMAAQAEREHSGGHAQAEDEPDGIPF